MKSLIAAVILALCCTAAEAGYYRDKNGDEWFMVDPPARYWDDPDLDTSKMNLYVEEPADVHAICQNATGKADQFGCALQWADRCDIYVVNDLPLAMRAGVVTHEVAHCMGWPSDHPMD